MRRLLLPLALPLILLVTAFFGTLVVVFSLFDRSGRAAGRLLAPAWGASMCFLAGVRLRVTGLDRLSASPPFVVAFNHSSHLDIPILFFALPFQLRFVAKAELGRIPIFGAAMRRLGNIVIDRSDRAQAIAGLKRAAEAMRAQRLSVVVAPEGTRSPDGRLLPFKKGAFVLALDTALPLLPVTISGAQAALPKGSLLPRGGRVTVTVGEPISTANLTYADRERLMAELRATFERHLGDPGKGR